MPAQVSTGVGVGKTLRLEVDALRALCVFRAVFRWSAAAYLSCFHLRIRRGGVGQFHLFFVCVFLFSVAYACVAPMALMCVLTMSRAEVAAVAAADESDYVLMMVMLWR